MPRFGFTLKKPIKHGDPRGPHFSKVLAAWCATRGEASRLAREMDVSTVVFSYWTTGKEPVPAVRCLELARLTNGGIQPIDLRPDINWST